MVGQPSLVGAVSEVKLYLVARVAAALAGSMEQLKCLLIEGAWQAAAF